MLRCVRDGWLALGLVAASVLFIQACIHDWNSFLPATGQGGDVGGGPGGVGGTAGGTAGTSSVGGTGGAVCAGGGAGCGGAGGVGGAPIAACDPGNYDTLVDDFADGVIGAQWAAFGDGAHDESDGLLILEASTDSTMNTGIYSVASYDLRGCSVTLDVDDVPMASLSGRMIFRVRWGDDDWCELGVSAGRLGAVAHADGADVLVVDTAYSKSQHRYWRMRATEGLLVFDTSGDGVVWSTLASYPVPAWISECWVQIDVTSYATGQPSPVRGRVDGVNVVPGPP